MTPEVYTLLAFILLLSLFLLNKFEQTSRYLYLFLSLFVFGLGAANHVLTFLTVPALLAYRILSRSTPPILPRHPLKLLGAGLAFLIGFSPFLIQFIRMLSVFSITEVFGPVIGSVFLTELLSLTPRLFLTSILTYLILLFFQFNPLALLLGGFGLLRGRQVSGANWLKVTAFFGVFTTFGILYRVTDQFAFFLISHLFFGILIAFGLAYAISRIKASNHAKLIYAMGLLTLGMPLLYGLIPKIAPSVGLTDETLEIPQIGTGTRDGFAYYVNPNKRGDQAAYRFGQEFYARAPQDALIIAEWYTDTDEYFVLQYFSRVESLRPDIEVIGWPMENPFTFDADIAVALIDEQVSNRPVYLASLSDTFYSASALSKKYCIIPELNLYRVYPADTLAKIPASRCLAIAGS